MCEEVGCDVATAKLHRDGDLGWRGRHRLWGILSPSLLRTGPLLVPQAMLPWEEAGTDLGALSLIERWAADGRADEHGAQGSAAAVVAGAVCDPGCSGLQGTEVGNGDLWPDGQSG